ncbi:MAG: Grx4 family monothiol glutaredoxin [Bdellovibrionales bacterium]|nr:Grx4 family monothiol glutaredoxin [Bdellovibrionales bacterium]
METQTKARIEDLLNQNRIVLFMKGTPNFPMCGFSARAVAILQELKAEFSGFNILEDEEIRQGIKEYGNWPTIPQLYVNKELVGGSDIMMEMFESGELKELLAK